MISMLPLRCLAILLPLAASIPAALAAETVPDEDRAVQPSLGVRFLFDSNTYDTASNAIDSWIGVIKPSILLTTAPAQQRYALLYQGEYGYYFEDSADNYADHVLGGAARYQLSARAKVEVTASTARGHWDRGSNQTDGLEPLSASFPSEPDVFKRNEWAGNFQYGADGNRGRLRFSVGETQLDYTNNLERTRFYDYDSRSASTGLSLLFHQRTAVVFDVLFSDFRYERLRPGEASRDSQDWRYLVGLTWEATAKTEGSIRLGMQHRRFDDPARASTSHPSWEVDVRWSPREYSHIGFETSRANEESFAEGGFVDISAYKVSWSHEWPRGWGSIISWAQNERDFVGSTRNQDFSETYLGLRYRQGRLLTWEAGFARRSRDGSFENLVYKGNMFSIGVNIGT